MSLLPTTSPEIKNGVTVTYTLKLLKENQPENSFSNLVLSFRDGTYENGMVINYCPDARYTEAVKVRPDVYFSGTFSVEKVTYQGELDAVLLNRCTTFSTLVCNWGGEEHTAGSNCTPSYTYVRTYTVCTDDEQPSFDQYAEDNMGSGGGGGSSTTAPTPTTPCQTSTGAVGISDGNGGCYINSNNCNAQGVVVCAPYVKYPVGSNYETLYPKLTEYLKNRLPTIKDNQVIVNAIKKYTNLTTAQIQQHLQWGSGPTIEIVQLDNFCNSCSNGTYGLFKNSTPNTLYIDIDLVLDMENSTPNSNLANAFAFLVGVTILHEYVHFGDNIDGVDYPGEEGELFETDVYGQSVTRSNANIILKGN